MGGNDNLFDADQDRGPNIFVSMGMFNKECLRRFTTRNSMLLDWLVAIGLTALLASLVFPPIAQARREIMLIAFQ